MALVEAPPWFHFTPSKNCGLPDYYIEPANIQSETGWNWYCWGNLWVLFSRQNWFHLNVFQAFFLAQKIWFHLKVFQAFYEFTWIPEEIGILSASSQVIFRVSLIIVDLWDDFFNYCDFECESFRESFVIWWLSRNLQKVFTSARFKWYLLLLLLSQWSTWYPKSSWSSLSRIKMMIIIFVWRPLQLVFHLLIYIPG